MRKWLFIFIISLLLLSLIQPAFGEDVNATNIRISMVLPLNTEYPLFEANNYENMEISNSASDKLTFRFNETNKELVYSHLEKLEKDSKVVELDKTDSRIGFKVQDYPDYSIYLYPDLLSIEDEIAINTTINRSDLIAKKTENITKFFNENFEIKDSSGRFEGPPLLPPLNKNDKDIYALDSDSCAKKTRIIVIIKTVPTINDTNV